MNTLNEPLIETIIEALRAFDPTLSMNISTDAHGEREIQVGRYLTIIFDEDTCYLFNDKYGQDNHLLDVVIPLLEQADFDYGCKNERISDENYQRFFGDEGWWKNPRRICEDNSTVSSVHSYHDEVKFRHETSIGDIVAVLRHVRKFPHGKGFHGYVDSVGSSSSIGYFAGTDSTAYFGALLALAKEYSKYVQKDADLMHKIQMYQKEIELH